MNGKCAKRIRLAASIISRKDNFDETVKRLKKEYRLIPYHLRTDKPFKESHSFVLTKKYR